MIPILAVLLATQPLPVLKNGQCPSGYSSSSAFCAPMGHNHRAAVPKPKNAQCPSGWAQSGNYCLSIK